MQKTYFFMIFILVTSGMYAEKNQQPTASKKTVSSQKAEDKQTGTQLASAPSVADVAKAHATTPEHTAMAASASEIPADTYEVDKVVAKIYAGEDSVIILASEVKPALDGMQRTLDDIIFERLVCLEAKKYKMEPDEEEIDKDIANIQKQHNITLDQLKNVLKGSGYTYEEGRNEIAAMRIIGQLLDFKIKSKLTVSDAAIEEYYNENPEIEQAAYHVAKTFVPYSTTKLSADFFDELEAMVKNKTKGASIEWQEPFWIEHSSLARDKMFITEMEPGQMVGPFDVGDGYEIYELVARKEERVKPLKERYAQIANILRKPKYDELLAEFKRTLVAEATIKFF